MTADDEAPNWTLGDHLQHGRIALKKIEVDPRAYVAQPVCHHFSEVEPIDPITVSRTETYSYLTTKFEERNLAFLSDRLEAWETTSPGEVWLQTRIADLLTLSAAHGLIYEGWSWEPQSGPTVCACQFQVLNFRSQ